ncbi:hypothetical protein EUA04_11575 [Mycolicibacterium obuense]|uniref:Uncharacterized protein n=1 Tax=Mycolicibacterium obuense TaxID=1807 RepID=A0A4R5X9T5_9MYCO|nr:hypothetical protein EUA04_11575 [Mycolicibacterium obuense]
MRDLFTAWSHIEPAAPWPHGGVVERIDVKALDPRDRLIDGFQPTDEPALGGDVANLEQALLNHLADQL